MEFITASTKDIEQLVDMRIGYLREDKKDMTMEQESQVRRQLPDYFREHLGKDIVAFVAKEDGKLMSTALLLMIEKPANPNFPTGRVGEVLSVFTRPEYRHKGMAKEVMSRLLAYAKEVRLDYVELSATEDGYPLYQLLGFMDTYSPYHPMKYVIDKAK